MPIYEYKCASCNFSFEERQGFDAEPVCVCPKCQGEARRLFRPAPIIFKGSGFYVTDHNGKSPSASGNGNGSEETKAELETKPAAVSTDIGESHESATE